MPFKDKERQRAYAQRWYAENKERKRASHRDLDLICRRTELARDGIAAVVEDIRAGRRFIDIAEDWLITEADVGDIARAHQLQRRARKAAPAAARAEA